MRSTLSNLEYFNLYDARGGKTVKGGDQEWYGSWWRRMSGCGPTTAANVVMYIGNARGGEHIREKQEFVRLMDKLWKYVTPGRGGVNTTLKLRQGIVGYSGFTNLNLRTEALDVSAEIETRPQLEHVTEFIRVGLKRDLPVAFLNLDNGLERQLDKWHWVTVTGVEYESEGGTVKINILDNCNMFDVNLDRWLKSTARGGGFVRFLL
ncbi:MAG: hypothetical protein LBK57_10055 [Clostridiales Family XIII bacterium]|jgi:hypothetical protein|nr:hypothetical protein [Clostridiales Family XIII bacterium]